MLNRISISQLKRLLRLPNAHGKRIIALDVGITKTGIALSDINSAISLPMISQPLCKLMMKPTSITLFIF